MASNFQEASSALRGLKCAICEDDAHGQHFGVLSCRPCAAFYRRCILEKLNYRCKRAKPCNVKIVSRRRCKGCRFQECKDAGMVLKMRRRKHQQNANPAAAYYGGNDMAIDDDDNDELANFMEAHSQLLDQQNAFFMEIGSSNGISSDENIEMINRNNSVIIPQMEKYTKEMLMEMLVTGCPQFAQLEDEFRHSLLDECFVHLNLLNLSFLTLEHFPDCDDARFFIAFGLFMDINSPNPIDFNPNELRAKFKFVQSFKQQQPPVDEHDICALMAIILCAKASSAKMVDLCADGQSGHWEAFRESIIRQWLLSIGRRIHSHTNKWDQNEATIQMARLLATLAQIDVFCTNLHNQFKNNSAALQISPSTSIPINTPFMREANELKNCIRLGNYYNRIWGSWNQTPPNILGKFGKLEDLVDGPDNILGMAETFNENPPFLNQIEKAKLFREYAQNFSNHRHHPRTMKSIAVFRLLAIGILKATPAFPKLTIAEKVSMVRHLRLPINFFINAFFSAQLGAKTWIGKDGITCVEIYQSTPEFRADPQLRVLAEKAHGHSVAPFLRFPMLKEEEFGLLLAILCSSNSAIVDLSPASQELLYEQQVHFSKLLLQNCQLRLGHCEGAKRYGECLQLVNSAFGSAHNFGMLFTYFETFHIRASLASTFPRCIAEIV